MKYIGSFLVIAGWLAALVFAISCIGYVLGKVVGL